jgi:lipopolysaccharide transport system ATP-binding protein
MPDAVVVENLSKRYRIGALQHETMLREVLVRPFRNGFRRRDATKDTILALDNISFTVEEGGVVGIIGRNGAGKSTLLKILSKITYPTSGRIKVRGRVASLIEIGTGFHEELTGRENIFLNGSILGMKKKEIVERMDSIIDFAGVEQFIDTPIKRYSSGMYLRLGFAVAAHMNPDILFVDEVLAVGDAGFQKKCLNAMDGMRSGGRSVLFVSHNMAAIENLCARTIWIESGRVKMDGPSREVISAYLSTFSSAEEGGHDLSRVEGRGGSGGIRFTKIEFLDPQGEPVNLFRCGEPLRARLHYHATETVNDPHFVFQIFSEMNVLVATSSTWHSGYHIPSISPGTGFIDMEIETLNIMQARYYISLWIDSTGHQKRDMLDHCVSIDVEPSNIYHTGGRGMTSKWGLVFLPTKWSREERT